MTAPKKGKPPEPLVAAFAERASPAAQEAPVTAAPRSFGVDFAKLKIFSDSPGERPPLDELPAKEQAALPAPADEGERPTGDIAPHVAPQRRARKPSNKRPPQR